MSSERRLFWAEVIEIDHTHGCETGPAVVIKTRAENALMTAYYSTDDARAVAIELVTRASLADFEDDFIRAATDAGYSEAAVNEILGLIRDGAEQRGDDGEPM